MELIIPTPKQSEFVLGALKTVVSGDDSLPETPRALIAAIQKHLLMTEYNIDSLPNISPSSLAQIIIHPQQRLQIVQAMIVLILSTGDVNSQQFQRIESYVFALELPKSILRNLHQLYRRQFITLSADVYYHCFIAQKYKLELKRQGLRWFLKGLVNYFGLIEDKKLAARYHQLELFPEETLGYQFWKFYQVNNYPFPGEKGSAHENTCFHDVTHILAGFDTSPEGEIQTVAMTVGYKYKQDKNPLSSIFFILLQQHIGLQIGLLSQAKKGILNSPEMPDKFVKAFQQGTAMKVDLSCNWNHWAAFNQPIEELRKEYNQV
jgi:hypothetical protein